MPSHGVLVSFGAKKFPKGNEGKRVSSGYNRRRRLATRSSGKQQAERTAVRTAPIVCPEESLLGARRRNPPFPDEGLTRRLRRGWWGCRPEGEVLSFEAKESTKESTRHGDSGKKASIAHFDGGARNVARIKESELSPTFVRAPVLTFFHRQNGRAFFPPLPIAALLPRRRRWADSNGGAWDAPMRLRWFRSAGKQVCFFAVGAIHKPIAPLGILQNGLDIFATKKASVVFYPR